MPATEDVASARAGQPSADGARLAVLDAITRLAPRGGLTLGDVVTETGLAPHAAEPILSGLVREYACDLDVREDGSLLYRFDPAIAAREDVVAADAARRRRAAFKRWLVRFFKGWTVAMVVVYFIVYAIIVLSAVSAASRGRGNTTSNVGRALVLILRGFLSAPWGYGSYGSWSSWRARRAFARDVERRLASGEDPYRLGAEEAVSDKPSLAERTWFHLFGVDGLARNPLEREKELLTYLRAKRGFLTNADIIALLGVTWEEADRIGTRLVATYDGEMDLTDSGVAVYRFPNLAPAVAPEIAREAPTLGYLWQVRAREQRLRDHPTYAIPILNAVNLVLGAGFAAVVLPNMHEAGFWTAFFLAWFPLAFSFLFLFLGIRRAARDAADRPRRERESRRIAIFHHLFTTRAPVVIPRDAAALARAGVGSWSRDALADDLAAIAAELQGTVEETAAGRALRVDHLWAELTEVERLRTVSASSDRSGRTVFSTREGHVSAEADALAAEIAALEGA